MPDPLMFWDDVDTSKFGKECLRIKHRIHESDLFSDEQLAKLIDHQVREHYHLETMEPQPDGSVKRREGQTGNVKGEDALEAVKNGSIWYIFLRPQDVDPRYGELLEDLYKEISDHVPSFKLLSNQISVLVSSPKVQVAYHADVPGQTLWQIRGVKRVYVYPKEPPFLHQPDLEKIVMRQANELSLNYEPSFDDAAYVHDLQPGEMVYWPLNAPHRISNHDCLNVSFTTGHTTPDTRRSYIVNYANGVLRRTLGMNRLSQKSSGLSYLTKMGIAGAYRFSGMETKNSRPYTIDFNVDPTAPRGVRDIEAYDLRKNEDVNEKKAA